MSSLKMSAIALLLTGTETIAAGVQRPAHPVNPSATASQIGGRVLLPRGAPAAFASVQVVWQERHRVFDTVADGNGAFTVTALPSGTYTVAAAKDGHLRTLLGANNGLPPRLVDISQGRNASGVEVRLVPGGTITGTVSRGDQEPAVGVTVVAALEASPGRFRAVGDSATTDERGEYRLFALPRGSYAVIALPPLIKEKRPITEVGFAATYFPSANAPLDAGRLDVSESSTSVADIVLVPSPLTSVSGRVLKSDGTPWTSGVITLRSPVGSGITTGRTAMIAPTGEFRFASVTSGDYVLEARQQLGSPRTVVGDVSRATVSVKAADVAGVEVRPWQPVRIAGRLTVPSSFKPNLLGWVQVGVTLLDRDGNMGRLPPAVVHPDLSFELSAWPGLTVVHVVDATTSWRLERAVLNGADVTNGFVAGGEQSVSGLDLVLTDRHTLLNGTLSGRTPADYNDVVVAAVLREGTGSGTNRCAVVRPTGPGAFSIRDLAPGSYAVAAFPEGQARSCRDSDFVQRVTTTGESVIVSESGLAQARLRIGQ